MDGGDNTHFRADFVDTPPRSLKGIVPQVHLPENRVGQVRLKSLLALRDLVRDGLGNREDMDWVSWHGSMMELCGDVLHGGDALPLNTLHAYEALPLEGEQNE